MIATAKNTRRPRLPDNWQDRFLSMLPAIEHQVAHRLHGVPAHEREDLTSEAIALAFAMFVRLAERGRIELAYATPLATYGCRQALVGRRLGSSMNVKDITSRHCQKRKCVRVEQLDSYDQHEQCWQEILVEDKNAGPAEIAATRIDFASWLGTLTPKQRRIANTLATGETTSAAARKFRLSPGRISQLRRLLQDAWLVFQGELSAA